MKNSKYYVTTPIYYPNAKPHLGTLYTTLIADFLARWNKIKGNNVFFLTGLDEHGQKIEEAANLKNILPQKFVDEMVPAFVDCWKKYQLNYDSFIRTSSEKHSSGVLKLFEKLIANGFIYKASYSGYYCVPDETFVTLQVTETPELCPTCGRATEIINEENYFFKLSAFQDKLLNFYSENPGFISPAQRMNEVVSFVKMGLKDLSITRRNVKWGIPFPGDPSHTIYVWGDALTNYISGIEFGSIKKDLDSFEKWWPADVHVLGKDIIRFHAIYWPAILMAADLFLPKKLLVHGYILVNNKKMSKSLGNSVDPIELASRFGINAVRYYLIKQMSIAQDGSFSTEDLKACYNADLANNFGNLISRIFTLAKKNNLLVINPIDPQDIECTELLQSCQSAWKTFSDLVDSGMLHQALCVATDLCSAINTLIHNKQPWKINSDKKELLNEIISTSFQALFQASIFLWPIIPEKIDILLSNLGLTQTILFSMFKDLGNWQQTMNLNFNIEPLFPRIETTAKEVGDLNTTILKTPETEINIDLPSEPTVSFEDFIKIKLAIGEIIEAKNVAGSDKLLQLIVSFGILGKKQVISGIAKEYSPISLLGKKAVFVINLTKRKIMGLESEAMILIAKDEKTFTMTSPLNSAVEPGTILS